MSIIPDHDLFDQLWSGSCVLIAGPDMGTGNGHSAPENRHLAQMLRERLAPEEHVAENLAQIAWRYEYELGRADLLGYLKELLDPPEIQPLPVCNDLAQLSWPLIITTALDRGLPLAFEHHSRPHQVILQADQIPPDWADDPLIIYLNGDPFAKSVTSYGVW